LLARSYNGGVAVSQEEREQVVDKGIMALDKALAIDPNYFERLSYINLIYREKAKRWLPSGRMQRQDRLYAKADEYQKQAIDLRKSQAAKAKSG
jgi:tetratricopeptide (TPR) repeat protein